MEKIFARLSPSNALLAGPGVEFVRIALPLNLRGTLVGEEEGKWHSTYYDPLAVVDIDNVEEIMLIVGNIRCRVSR